MHLKAVVIIFISAVLTEARSPTVGAPEKMEPYSDPAYYHLAEYALENKPIKINSRYVTVLELKKVTAQVVSGTSYNVTFTTALTSCRKNFDPHRCARTSKTPEHLCRATFWEKVWEDFLEMTNFVCKRLYDTDDVYTFSDDDDDY